MAIALVTSGKAAAASNPTTGSLNTSNATLLVAVVTYAGSPTGVSDNKGNTWTALTAYANTGVTSRIYYVNSNTPTVGSGHTFTLNGTSIAGVINVMAFSGTASSPLDSGKDTGNNSGSAATLAPGSLTPSQNNSILITGFSGGNTYGGAGTIDLSYTITDNTTLSGGVNYGSAAAYLILSSATAKNPTWTLGSTVSNIASSHAVFLGTPFNTFNNFLGVRGASDLSVTEKTM